MVVRAEEKGKKKIMDNQIELEKAILGEDFIETSELLEKIYNSGSGKKYVEFLINFMSDNPDVDYGMPGPVVHFIEKYPIDYYVVFLLKSIEKRPNDTLLWMLNRITNVADKKTKNKYIEIFRNVIARKDIDGITREAAIDFYEFQKENDY